MDIVDMKKIPDTTGQRIKEQRKNKKQPNGKPWSQNYLGGEIGKYDDSESGICKQNISRWENGTISPDEINIKRIAAAICPENPEGMENYLSGKTDTIIQPHKFSKAFDKLVTEYLSNSADKLVTSERILKSLGYSISYETTSKEIADIDHIIDIPDKGKYNVTVRDQMPTEFEAVIKDQSGHTKVIDLQSLYDSLHGFIDQYVEQLPEATQKPE